MKHSHSQPWHYLAARLKKLYVPPGRPSPDNLKGYRQLLRRAIRGKKHPRALVLGATPDLRDLLYEERVQCTMVDLSMQMIQEMTLIRKFQDPDETLVRANWVSTPLASCYFDVIMGDFVAAQLPWNLQHRFFKARGSFYHAR